MTFLARLTLLLMSLIAFPIWVTALFVMDTVNGERLFRHLLIHEQRSLLETFTADYLAALPFALFLTGVILLGAWSARRRLGNAIAVAVPVVGGALAGAAAATFVTGRWIDSTHGVLIVAGALYGLPISFALRHLLRTPETEQA